MKKQWIYFLCWLGFFVFGSALYAQQDWHTTGNTVNTNDADFLGTLNMMPLNFRVGNNPAGRIDPQGRVFFGYQAGNVNAAPGTTAIGTGALSGVGSLNIGNTAVGRNALHTNPIGNYNSALGEFSLQQNWNGNGNTGMGALSLYYNYSGNENTANGAYSLEYNYSGNYNTGMGANSIFSNTVGNNNTGIGWSSLRNNTTGNDNTAIGYSALFENTIGQRNTANGANALHSNQTGTANTASGYNALRRNTVGSENTAMGGAALDNNQIGKRNTAMGANALAGSNSNSNSAFGYGALFGNTIGYSNTAMGVHALYNNTTRSNLVAIGDSALFMNGIGAMGTLEATSNTAVGSKALYANTKGYQNAALGTNALRNNTTGYDNSAVGGWSLIANTTGYRNVSMGTASMMANTTGWANTSYGWHALFANTTGQGNVAHGYKALLANVTGFNNTAVGNAAFLTGTNFNNSSAIGYQAQPLAGNEVVLGNASIVRLRCNTATITTGSDKRIKDNIQENVPGLEFIQKLRPVTYHINVDKLNAILEVKDSSDAPGKYDVEKKQMTGFIAQEVEQAARKCNFEFSGVDQPEKEGGLYGLRYSEFVVPLVKAAQELNDKDEAQAKEIQSQKETIQNLQAQLDELKAMVQGCCNINSDKGSGLSAVPTGNRLDQNTPNPFDGNTVIRYYVAEQLPNTYIRIVTMEGFEQAKFPITQQGEGQITVSGNSLANGVYIYELIVGSEMVASRKMVLTR